MQTDPVSLWHTARLRPTRLLRYRFWRRGHWQALRRPDGRQGPLRDDRVHLAAAADWLARAQDATPDGGIMGRYRLASGWSSSYPETTGYIVPTFLALAEHHDSRFRNRAERAIRFLLDVQLPDGAFPAGEIAVNRTRPSPFNTAQILHGLLEWHRATDDAKALEAARRAGAWLLDAQDADGAWRKWFYLDIAACYAAHLSCWLADLGAFLDDAALLEGARRHLDWVLGHRDATTGWFDATGFTENEQSLRIADLHTIGYTLAGVLRLGERLGRDDAIASVDAAAQRVGATLDRLGWLPGVLDHEWRSRADSACLTGNVQMALVWMRLHRLQGGEDRLRHAHAAIDLVKRAQLVDSPAPCLRGGVPGSTPIWGWYNDGAMLSWSAKFLVDALLEKAAIGASS